MQLLAALSAVLPLLVAAADVKFNDVTLNIVNGPASPDGFVRASVLANGTFPGPLIRATKGDVLRVTVNNHLTDPLMRRSTSIDFDGLFFDTDNAFNEGTPFVTQCPIAPGHSYTYTLPLAKEQAGTYWYHSQLSVQYADGLRGPLIIYDPEDPQAHLYDVDDEDTIWFINDWWHNQTLQLLQFYHDTQIIPVADSGFLNGRGRYNTGPLTPYDVTNVVSGKRYRFRMINASARSDFTTSVDGHNITIIAVDGVNSVPHTVNTIDLLAGQRYDVVLTANQPVANYWINTILGGGTASRNPNLNITLGRGILRYKGAPIAEPTTPMTTGPQGDAQILLQEVDLRPLVPIPAPEPDVQLIFQTFLIANASSPSGFNTQWSINGSSYLSPLQPTLLRVLDGEAVNNASFAPTENTFVLPANAVIEVKFPPSTEDELHPFHLHGNNYWVIKSNGSDVVNTVNPIRRDVTGMGAGGTTVRFTTDRPGPWFFHCHIFWHMNAGLASVMMSGIPQTKAQVHPTPAWEDLCEIYNALPPDMQ